MVTDRPRTEKAATAARRAALAVLSLVSEGVPFDAALDRSIDSLEDRDRRLVHELAAGVLRQQTVLDDRLAPAVTRGLGAVDPRLLRVLRLGAYQLTVLDRVPAHAAVSTSVELAREAGGEPAAGFVNAVLRKLERGPVVEPEGPGSAAETGSRAAGLARRFSHPVWLVERWLARFGATETEALLRWNNTHPPLVVQPAREEQPALLSRWSSLGLDVRPAPWDAGIVVTAGSPRGLDGYQAGAFVVQDPAQALVARFAAVPPGALVYDACASPGGKAIALGRRARLLVAGDGSRSRVRRLKQNLARAGSGREHAVVADAKHPPLGSADVVLLDAPCLGTGTLARHPDARWRVRAAALRTLAHTQGRLLDAVAGTVRPGGLLIYATCSLEPEENDTQVDRFLSRHPEFRRDLPADFPRELVTADGDLQLLPHRHATDGAFAARLRRAA